MSADDGKLMIRLADPRSGALIGGLYGERFHGWLMVRYLAIPSELRGQGLGSRMLEMAQDHALSRSCRGLWLDTFSFQAPDFYRRHGFESFGQIDGYPGSHSRIFMLKRLDGIGGRTPGLAD